MKQMKYITVVFLGVLMTGCSTSKIDGLAVSNVSNTECLQMSRTRGESDGTLAPTTLVLTREGDNIVAELRNYRVECLHYDLIVSCKQEGSELEISVSEDLPKGNGDRISVNCLCPVNIYFTINDIEGDIFHVNVGWRDFGNASFKEGNRVELTEIVHENIIIQE
jgi:hypothetical protein